MWLIYNLDDDLLYLSNKQNKFIKNCLDYYHRKYKKAFFRDSVVYHIRDKFGIVSYRSLYTKKYKIYYYYGI